MKKFISVLLTLVLALTVLSSCGGDAKDDKTIKVGASITPHAEILEIAKEILAKDGYTLTIVEYNDYILPNTATESGELDANYFQHQPYLTNFNEENNTHLVSVAGVHYEPFAIYKGKTASLAELPDGATIAIPNDGSNEARALFLLEAQGLITLNENVGYTATILDIKTNPKNLKIQEIEAAQLIRSLPDVDLAVINGNYAISAGLKIETDAIAVEDASSDSVQTYVNIVAVKEGNEKNEAIQALVKALLSDEVRDFINTSYDGGVVPLF